MKLNLAAMEHLLDPSKSPSVDIAKLAGLYPAGVLVEILNEDGTMARLHQLISIAKRHNLKIISIKDLVAYRMRNERIIKKELSTTLVSEYGEIKVIAYRQLTTDDIHLAFFNSFGSPKKTRLVDR